MIFCPIFFGLVKRWVSRNINQQSLVLLWVFSHACGSKLHQVFLLKQWTSYIATFYSIWFLSLPRQRMIIRLYRNSTPLHHEFTIDNHTELLDYPGLYQFYWMWWDQPLLLDSYPNIMQIKWLVPTSVQLTTIQLGHYWQPLYEHFCR